MGGGSASFEPCKRVGHPIFQPLVVGWVMTVSDKVQFYSLIRKFSEIEYHVICKCCSIYKIYFITVLILAPLKFSFCDKSSTLL